MPELPEVEVTRLSFAPAIAGAKIRSASLNKPLRWPLGCDVTQLDGKTGFAAGALGHVGEFELFQAPPRSR
jgi:formamidopyrimidine-DNA glycosylase